MARAVKATGAPTSGTLVDKTPVVVPTTLAALALAVPPAGQPANERWIARYGVAPNTELAMIIGGAWGDADPGTPPPERVHLTNAAVAPAAAGAPTLAEIATAAGATRNTILYYTGTNTPTDAPTHVWHIDGSGDVTALSSPLPGTEIGRGNALPDPALTTFDAFIVEGTADPVGEPDGLYHLRLGNWVHDTGAPQAVQVGTGSVLPDAATTTFLVFIIANSAAPVLEPDGLYYRTLGNWVRVF